MMETIDELQATADGLTWKTDGKNIVIEDMETGEELVSFYMTDALIAVRTILNSYIRGDLDG